MDKFTVEQVKQMAADMDRIFTTRTEPGAMLRDYAKRLREDDENAKDAARWRHSLRVGRFPSQSQDGERWVAFRSESALSGIIASSPNEAIDAAMHEQGEG